MSGQQNADNKQDTNANDIINSSSEDKLGCSVCMRKGVDLRCGRCNISTYCSKECQVIDWPIHKQICRKLDVSIVNKCRTIVRRIMADQKFKVIVGGFAYYGLTLGYSHIECNIFNGRPSNLKQMTNSNIGSDNLASLTTYEYVLTAPAKNNSHYFDGCLHALVDYNIFGENNFRTILHFEKQSGKDIYDHIVNDGILVPELPCIFDIDIRD